jgi:heat shock protein HslJ
MIRSLVATLILSYALLPIVSSGAPDPHTTAPSSAAGAVSPQADGALAGTAWQLVEIVSTDDRVDAPDDRSLYTVEFKQDGVFLVKADCNRGAGSWTSASAGHVQFGQIAATQAMCPPGSLHDRYMAQFPSVCSYVTKHGHLFLTTMAEDSVIEFEPMKLPLAATVLGVEVRTSDPGEMQEIVLTRLFDRYAAEQGIEVTDGEIAAYVDDVRRGMRAEGLTAEDDLTPEEAAQVEQMRRNMGRSMIRHWKLNRALYRQYGGRIIFQQLGPEPLDAYRKYLEERQVAGDFTIHQKDFEDEFWRYFTSDSMHDFYEPGSEEETQAFRTPPWERAAADTRTMAQPAPPAESAGSATASAAKEDTTGPLADTRWRLLRFQSMDDATGEIEPEDPSAYTMTLSADGSVQMQLNCNRAIGTWSVQAASDGISGSFTFGPLATTKALCPAPSMDERIARDAQWVRGYLLRDGQLHLSLMADGGIYSWEPASERAGAGSFASEPDAAVEDALRAAEPDYVRDIIDITGTEGRYVYGRFDLNADGREEVLVLLMGSSFCGTGGCNLHLFSDSEEGYSLINTFPRSRLPVIAAPRKTAGWHDLIRLETGGGVAPSYVRHTFDGEKYVAQERLPAEPAPEGKRLLDGDYSYATGFPLEPRSE